MSGPWGIKIILVTGELPKTFPVFKFYDFNLSFFINLFTNKKMKIFVFLNCKLIHQDISMLVN